MTQSNCYNTGATVTATLAAGSTASPYFVMANLTKRLCRSVCADNIPVFAPAFSVIGFSQVGEGQYAVTVQVQGIISYEPCGTSCCPFSEPVSRTFTIPFTSSTTPSAVTVEAGTTVNDIYVQGCRSCGRDFVSETPLTLTVTTAS